MYSVVTIWIPGLVESVNETIQATNYHKMLTAEHFITAAVQRINSDEHTSLDVLFAYVHSLAPELRDWPYEADDDWLLLDQLTALANRIKPLIRPLMPPAGIPRYYGHTDDTLTMLIHTSAGYNYAF